MVLHELHNCVATDIHCAPLSVYYAGELHSCAIGPDMIHCSRTTSGGSRGRQEEEAFYGTPQLGKLSGAE